MKISFDEWNVWYQNKQEPAGWVKAPHILEDIYSVKDALVFSGMLNTLINNCDRVEIACFAQMVNVIAPIFTEKGGRVIRQATFYPFAEASNHGRGHALKTITESPTFASKYGEVKWVSDAIVYNEEKQEIAVFLVNYGPESVDLQLELRSFGKIELIEHKMMQDDDIEAKNSFENPDRVVLKPGAIVDINDCILTTILEPRSYHVLRCRYKL